MDTIPPVRRLFCWECSVFNHYCHVPVAFAVQFGIYSMEIPSSGYASFPFRQNIPLYDLNS